MSNLASILPTGWKLLSVKDAFTIRNNLRKPISQEEREKIQGEYPYYGPTKAQGYISSYEQDGKFALIGEDGDHFLKYQNISMTQLISGKCTVNNHAHVVQGTDICIAEWFYYFFMHKELTSFLTRQGAGRFKLNKAALEKIPVLVPPVAEQTKIAQILSTWDKAIATAERLLANSQQQKQALMQQLLTGKVRFPNAEGEWHEVEIGNIIKEVKRPVVWDDDAQYRLLSVKRRAEGVVLREVLAGSQILTKKMNTARAGDFLISKMQVTHGAMGLVTDEFDNHHISDSYIAVIAKDLTKLDINFFSWLGRTKALWRLAFLSSYGVHIEKLAFNFSLFLKEKINIPTSLAEQQKIAQVLTTADSEIANLQAQLAKLKLEKKALMQQLLTGQRRVKLDDEVEEAQIRRVG